MMSVGTMAIAVLSLLLAGARVQAAFLRVGSPLTWEESLPHSGYVR